MLDAIWNEPCSSPRSPTTPMQRTAIRAAGNWPKSMPGFRPAGRDQRGVGGNKCPCFTQREASHASHLRPQPCKHHRPQYRPGRRLAVPYGRRTRIRPARVLPRCPPSARSSSASSPPGSSALAGGREDDLDAPILAPVLGRIVRRDRVVLTVARGRKQRGIDALILHVLDHRHRPGERKLPVGGESALRIRRDIVGVPFDADNFTSLATTRRVATLTARGFAKTPTLLPKRFLLAHRRTLRRWFLNMVADLYLGKGTLIVIMRPRSFRGWWKKKIDRLGAKNIRVPWMENRLVSDSLGDPPPRGPEPSSDPPAPPPSVWC